MLAGDNRATPASQAKDSLFAERFLGDSGRLDFNDLDEFQLEDQMTSRQGMVSVEGDGRLGLIGDSQRNPTGSRRLATEYHSNLEAHIADDDARARADYPQISPWQTVTVLGDESHRLLLPRGHSNDRLLESRNQRALSKKKANGLVGVRGTEHPAVFESTPIVNLDLVSQLCSQQLIPFRSSLQAICRTVTKRNLFDGPPVGQTRRAYARRRLVALRCLQT